MYSCCTTERTDSLTTRLPDRSVVMLTTCSLFSFNFSLIHCLDSVGYSVWTVVHIILAILMLYQAIYPSAFYCTYNPPRRVVLYRIDIYAVLSLIDFLFIASARNRRPLLCLIKLSQFKLPLINTYDIRSILADNDMPRIGLQQTNVMLHQARQECY